MLWRSLASSDASLDELVIELCRAFDVDDETARRDVESWLVELDRSKLLERIDEPR